MIFEMLRWWYTTGWLQALDRITSWPASVERAFSIVLLLKTLFAPWRRIVSAAGKSLDDKIRASLDNMVSRTIGFFVRLGALLAAGVSTFAVFLAAAVTAIAWPFLPFAILYCLFRSITG